MQIDKRSCTNIAWIRRTWEAENERKTIELDEETQRKIEEKIWETDIEEHMEAEVEKIK